MGRNRLEQHARRLGRDGSLLVALFLVVTMLLPQAVDAWQTSHSSTQGYRGDEQTQPYRGAFWDLADAIDDFWLTTFRAATISYESPGIVALDRRVSTACGQLGPENEALYCLLDSTIYLNPDLLVTAELLIGDYAPIVVLAHEWGHHIQNLLQAADPGGNVFELQADCLAGVYTRDAEDKGLLEPGDFLEGLTMSEMAGDSAGFPQDAPGAHGTYADRRNAVIRGYLDGVAGCDLPHLGGNTASSTTEQTSTETRTSIPEEWNPSLPERLRLAHASCFGIVDDENLPFEEIVDRLGGTNEARNFLQDWGWQGTVRRTFGCDGPPLGEAGWIDIMLYRFASPAAARQAVDYFALVRAEDVGRTFEPPPAVGDYAVAMSGRADNGTEYTVYASLGPWMIRVTGVSPSDFQPTANVVAVAETVLSPQSGTSEPEGDQQPSPPQSPASDYLPESPAVNYAECFQILDEGTYAYRDLVDALLPTGISRVQIDGLGWHDGAYRVFRCEHAPFGRATQIDVVIHQFQDSSSAQEVLPYFQGTYRPGENESRACNTGGALVVCVLGRSVSGSPLSDVHFVLNQVLAAI